MQRTRSIVRALGLPALLTGTLLSPALAQELVHPAEPDVETLARHYARAEKELRAASTDHLSEQQRGKRAQALDWLRTYREGRDFGRNLLHPGTRQLYFIDPEGRRCAVACLLDHAGENELVERIAATNNHAYVAELADVAELGAWLQEYGLTIQEAARIQGPGGAPGDTGSPSFPRPPGGTWSGPGDAVPTGPSSGSGSGGPSAPGPSGPSNPRRGGGSTPGPAGPSAPGPSGPQTGGPATGPMTHGVGPGAWRTWWDLHKMDYLRPNLLANWHGAVTQWEDDGSDPLAAVRAELIPVLLEALSAEDARLRGAAAVALGRMAGERAIEPLVARLGDPDHGVRERALLGLGATGTARAAELLLHVADSGALPEGEEVTHDGRALAVLSLAIGRRNGMSPYFDHALNGVLAELEGADRFLVQGSGLLYQTMNPGQALDAWCFERSTDESTALGVRCRAAETLRTRDDDESLAVLLHHLSGPSLELRRSAALALGEFEHPLALQPLLTAVEVEKEPLARAFCLISIGRQGGDTARDFLREFLREGPKSSRSWCALALGILAREGDDALARSAIRAGLGREKNREFRGAYYLAMGIARDLDARALLIDALKNGSSYELRSGAAMALGMLGTPEGHQALREQLERDSCEYTRADIAEALGFAGEYGDSPQLARALDSMKQEPNQRVAALALGLHGQRRSVEKLIALVRDPEQEAGRRAAAIDALQVVLGAEPSLAVGDMLRQSNFLVFQPTLIKIRNVLL